MHIGSAVRCWGARLEYQAVPIMKGQRAWQGLAGKICSQMLLGLTTHVAVGGLGGLLLSG